MNAYYKDPLLHNLVDNGIKTQTHIQELGSVDVAVSLDKIGINTVSVIEKAEYLSSSRHRPNNNALTSDQSVGKKVILLLAIALIGACLFITALGYSNVVRPDDLQTRYLVLLVFIGGIGVFLSSLVAALHVLWNAYTEKVYMQKRLQNDIKHLVKTMDETKNREEGISTDEFYSIMNQIPSFRKHTEDASSKVA